MPISRALLSIGVVDRNVPVPLYHQVKRALLEAIERAEWEAGQQLPNETQLAQTFGVSKITVRQALQELALLGYIRREQGRRTFVSKPKLDQGPRELTSFTEEMRRHRHSPASCVISRSLVKADARVAEKLDLPEGVFALKRLRLADDEPMGVQTAHLPAALVPGLIDRQLENASLYEVLRARYGLEPREARETYFAVAADAEAAELLEIDAGSPVFAVERVTWLADGRPLEFVESIMRGDRYNIILERSANRTLQATREGATR